MLLLLALLLSTPCPGDSPLFHEREPLPGLTTTCGSPAKDYIIEVNGGGLALGDFDGDGSLDVVVVDGSTLERVAAGEEGNPPRLFLNDGKGGLREAGEEWRMSGGRWGMGAAAADVDGDGWLDLLVTQWGPPRLFLNRAGKGFEEKEDAGFSGGRWGTSAAFLDYDRDGVLDLCVVNYLAFDPDEIQARGEAACTWKGHPVMCGPEGLVPVFDQLFRGKGDGTFEDVTFAAQFRPTDAGFGLGVTTLDYDDDGDTDLYVTNDSTPNHLWENRGDGTFEEVGFRRGASHDASGREQAGMGIAAADVDGDGREELFVTNFSGESNAFYDAQGKDRFRERADRFGLAGPSLRMLGWGTGFGDFDLDGALEIYVLNGHVYPQADEPGTDTSYAQEDVLYRRKDRRWSAEPLSDGPPRVSRTGAAGDLDGDGDLDLVVFELDGGVRALENRTPKGHWLRVRLSAPGKNRAALGAHVTAHWAGAARSVEIRTSGGFQSAVPAEAHFGLGEATRVERLEVRWPDGTEQVLEDLAADRVLVVEEAIR